jgi:hypothetical protein
MFIFVGQDLQAVTRAAPPLGEEPTDLERRAAVILRCCPAREDGKGTAYRRSGRSVVWEQDIRSIAREAKALDVGYTVHPALNEVRGEQKIAMP